MGPQITIDDLHKEFEIQYQDHYRENLAITVVDGEIEYAVLAEKAMVTKKAVLSVLNLLREVDNDEKINELLSHTHRGWRGLLNALRWCVPLYKLNCRLRKELEAAFDADVTISPTPPNDMALAKIQLMALAWFVFETTGRE